MDQDEMHQKGEAFWDRGGPSLPLKQYLERHAVRGRALVPGCGRGHEVALAVEHGLIGKRLWWSRSSASSMT